MAVMAVSYEIKDMATWQAEQWALVEPGEDVSQPISRGELVEPSDFMRDNPFIIWDAKDAPHLQGVPTVVWWVEHPSLGLSHVRYNALTGRIDAEALPWDDRPHAWTDADTSQLYAELQERTGGLFRSRPDLLDAVTIVAHRHGYDPLRDMLDGLPAWDGEPRAETILVDYLGADDTAYTRAATRLMLNGALMRAFHPGCKFDSMIVLVGGQGGRKSSLVRKLNMDDGLFLDQIGDIGRKEASENLQGAWIVEVGELEGLRKREVETVKQFVSRQDDKYRTPYGKFSEIRPRRCIFIGTTNSTSFLKDITGNRRFLPIACNVERARLDLFAPEADAYIRQVWAEMVFEYRELGSLPLVLPEGLRAEAEEAQGFYAVDDGREGMIAGWLHAKCMPGDRICILELLEEVFEIPRSEAVKPAGKALMNELSQLLDGMPDLERLSGKPKHSERYGQQRCWVFRSGG